MKEKLLHLLRFHLDHHPSLQVQDIYKCLYQGVFGAEHLLTNEDKARDYFFSEFERIPAENKPPLVEPVSVDGGIVRVNFRPFKAMGGSAEKLWETFRSSARLFAPQPDLLETLWRLFYSLCKERKCPFDPVQVREFDEKQKAAGYPPQHHTPDYRRDNEPAYRVVGRGLFDSNCRIRGTFLQ
ncbi:hypothetical protein JW935_02695 [candidate division KSB1 bacterium]|nr:hypothetical protein [candidate division KSB1 bacterium]